MSNECKIKHSLSYLLVILVLFLAIPVVSACNVLPGPRQPGAMTGGTYLSPQGLQVATRDVQPDEIAEILDIQRWKFVVEPPEGNQGLHFTLDLLPPGEEPETLYSFGLNNQSSEAQETLVAIYPIDESIYQAEQIKIHVSSGSASSSAVVDNPFMGLEFSSPYQPAELQEDGSYKLMAFSPNGSLPSADDILLVFRVRLSGDEMSN